MPPPPPPHPLRRHVVGAAVAAVPAWCLGVRAQAPVPRRVTPAQTEGPFYPVALPQDSDFDLLRNGQLAYTQGQPAWIEGSLTDPDGRPIAGAEVEIWQCDNDGHYHHPGDGNRAAAAFQGFGKVRVDASGQYRFRTIRPVAYSGRAPHIHVKVRLGPRTLLISQLYVQDDPANARDFVWRNLNDAERAAVTAPWLHASDGLRARYPLVVAA